MSTIRWTRLEADVEIGADRGALLLPRVGLGERRLRDPLHHLLLDLLDHRREQVAFVAEVVIDARPG